MCRVWEALYRYDVMLSQKADAVVRSMNVLIPSSYQNSYHLLLRLSEQRLVLLLGLDEGLLEAVGV
jgi:hypothetical protein